MTAKIRHVAISTEDPRKTADWYKDVFGLQEVGTNGGDGIYLSDGEINFAVLRIVDKHTGKVMTGVHHFGVVVENRKELSKKLEAMGAPCILDEPQSPTSFFEVKHRGPDGVVIDTTEHPWKGCGALD